MTGILEDLNRDVWHPFVRTYGALDADAFLALYHPDLIRASGTANEVHDFAGYAAQIREFFAMVAGFGDVIAIDFRFHERIATSDLASERGVFRLSVTPTTGRPRTHPFRGCPSLADLSVRSMRQQRLTSRTLST